MSPDTQQVDPFENAPDREASQPRILSRAQKTLQEVLFRESLDAVPYVADLPSLDELRPSIACALPQNSENTRLRYADSIIRWFFRDGLNGLALRVWKTYGDLAIQGAIHRYLYLSIEPIVAHCVVNVLGQLTEGIVVPEGYLASHTEKLVGHELVDLTRRRLVSNLRKLGFLERSAAGDRFTIPVMNRTALLIAMHHEFVPDRPRTIEFATLVENPFWRFLGVRSQDVLRDFLSEADHAGLIGKYVVADRLEQVTSCYTLNELLQRRATM